MIDIKAIKAAAEAATKGEWSWQEGTPLVTKLWNGAEHSIAAVDWRTLAWHEDGNCAGRESGANAKHIATANPATVIALCDEIERLRADSARYQWLREQNADEPGKLGVFRYEQMGTCVSEFEPVWVGADLDAVVDAAMEAK